MFYLLTVYVACNLKLNAEKTRISLPCVGAVVVEVTVEVNVLVAVALLVIGLVVVVVVSNMFVVDVNAGVLFVDSKVLVRVVDGKLAVVFMSVLDKVLSIDAGDVVVFDSTAMQLKIVSQFQ